MRKALPSTSWAHEQYDLADGPVLAEVLCEDPTQSHCDGDAPMFKGIALRYLAALAQQGDVDADTRVLLRNFVQGSANAIWNHARDLSDNLVSQNWTAPFNGQNDLGAQTSAAMALAAAASLDGQSPAPNAPTVFEAEDATLVGVGIEANGQGFSGWGYVAGWGNRGQGVIFRAANLRGGQYTLTARYAASAGAQRTWYFNGTTTDVQFAATGSYDAYQEVRSTVTLPAGNIVLELWYSGPNDGSFVNLDAITLQDQTPASSNLMGGSRRGAPVGEDGECRCTFTGDGGHAAN